MAANKLLYEANYIENNNWLFTISLDPDWSTYVHFFVFNSFATTTMPRNSHTISIISHTTGSRGWMRDIKLFLFASIQWGTTKDCWICMTIWFFKFWFCYHIFLINRRMNFSCTLVAPERGEEGEWDKWEGGGRTKKGDPRFLFSPIRPILPLLPILALPKCTAMLTLPDKTAKENRSERAL
jgi:hypothetical protein